MVATPIFFVNNKAADCLTLSETISGFMILQYSRTQKWHLLLKSGCHFSSFKALIKWCNCGVVSHAKHMILIYHRYYFAFSKILPWQINKTFFILLPQHLTQCQHGVADALRAGAQRCGRTPGRGTAVRRCPRPSGLCRE